MSHPKFTALTLFIGLLLGISPLMAQEGSAEWLPKLEFTQGGLAFPATAGVVTINGDTVALTDQNGRKYVMIEPGLHLVKSGGNSALYHLSDGIGDGPDRLRRIPLWLSILPPLIAIGLAQHELKHRTFDITDHHVVDGGRFFAVEVAKVLVQRTID